MNVRTKPESFRGERMTPRDIEALDVSLSYLYEDLRLVAAQVPAVDVTIRPPALSANANDYEPEGLSGADVVLLKSNSAVDITGMKCDRDGHQILLVNIGSNNITLKASSASSSPPNRFQFGADHTLAQGNTARLYYSSLGPFWCPVSFGS